MTTREAGGGGGSERAATGTAAVSPDLPACGHEWEQYYAEVGCRTCLEGELSALKARVTALLAAQKQMDEARDDVSRMFAMGMRDGHLILLAKAVTP